MGEFMLPVVLDDFATSPRASGRAQREDSTAGLERGRLGVDARRCERVARQGDEYARAAHRGCRHARTCQGRIEKNRRKFAAGARTSHCEIVM
jgi:hypothetical protein